MGSPRPASVPKFRSMPRHTAESTATRQSLGSRAGPETSTHDDDRGSRTERSSAMSSRRSGRRPRTRRERALFAVATPRIVELAQAKSSSLSFTDSRATLSVVGEEAPDTVKLPALGTMYTREFFTNPGPAAYNTETYLKVARPTSVRATIPQSKERTYVERLEAQKAYVPGPGAYDREVSGFGAQKTGRATATGRGRRRVYHHLGGTMPSYTIPQGPRMPHLPADEPAFSPIPEEPRKLVHVDEGGNPLVGVAAHPLPRAPAARFTTARRF